MAMYIKEALEELHKISGPRTYALRNILWPKSVYLLYTPSFFYRVDGLANVNKFYSSMPAYAFSDSDLLYDEWEIIHFTAEELKVINKN